MFRTDLAILYKFLRNLINNQAGGNDIAIDVSALPTDGCKQILGIELDEVVRANRDDLCSYVLLLEYLDRNNTPRHFAYERFSYWQTIRSRDERIQDAKLFNDIDEFCRLYGETLRIRDEQKKKKLKELQDQAEASEQQRLFIKSKEIDTLSKSIPTITDLMVESEKETETFREYYEYKHHISHKAYMFAPREPITSQRRELVFEWFDELKRLNKGYKSFGVVLALPGDEIVSEFLAKYSVEIDLLSGQNCLVIFFTDKVFKMSNRKFYSQAVKDHIWKGYCLEVAKLLKISFTDFPCFVLFDDIYKDKCVTFTLKGLTVDEIKERFRSIFATLEKTSNSKSSPVSLLTREKNLTGIRKVSNSLFSNTMTFATKTFEAILESAISTMFK